MNRIEELFINKNATIRQALKQMDELGRKLLIVVNEDNKFFSLISIGDIQRAIIRNLDINTKISNVLRTEVRVASVTDNLEKVKERMRLRRNEFMPVVSSEGDIVNIILWEDLFKIERPATNKKFDLPVIIMAGGEGRRLKPITNVLPKPLLPIGNKTVIEKIMDRFIDLGSNRFFLSLNYKADLIEYYLNSLPSNEYCIEYFREVSPLGTAGSLHLLKGKINETFFISNCDILVDQDYSEILDYHRENNNEITLVAALKNFSIPYGVLKTGKNGILEAIQEKPDLTFKINTGLYILEPHLLSVIPDNEFYHITQLIDSVNSRGGNVGVFPISEGSWKDIGVWQEYLKTIQNE